jgi:poly(3-hydroxybutyrate) depolymerase
MRVRRYLLVSTWLLLAATSPASIAASTVDLPGSMCPGGDAIFRDGYEVPATIPHDPSNGSGGSAPGDVTRAVSVSGVGMRNYYLHLPTGYTPAHSWPILLALHGSSGSAASAPAAAQQIRTDWSGWSESRGFIVLAPIATGSQGGWLGDDDVATMDAALADAGVAYNVERSRIYLWGFSAGGHLAHSLALYNADFFAAYGVSAGSLQAYTCTDAGPPTCASVLTATHPKIPVDIHIGNNDPLYTLVAYDVLHERQRFEAGGWVSGRNLFRVVFVGGHEYTVAHLGEIWNHICPFALGP